MKITKYLHSCLLVEEDGKTILIDPGIFTYQEKVFDVNSLQKLDAILITHEHPDHCHVPFIQDILSKFPGTQIMTNQSVVELLQENAISASTASNEFVQLTPMPHERVFDKQAPANVQLDIFNKLTHPGDSISFTSTQETLALPLLGPSWMITNAVEKAVEIKPKFVIPIHDYHWKDGVRKEYYNRLKDFFEKQNIIFYPLETGEPVEV